MQRCGLDGIIDSSPVNYRRGVVNLIKLSGGELAGRPVFDL